MKKLSVGCLAALALLPVSFAFAQHPRGVWIHDTPCAEDEILKPAEYRPWPNGKGADARYVCQNAEDYSISLLRRVESTHDSVTCFIVAKRPRHWYRDHGLKVVATEMCHH